MQQIFIILTLLLIILIILLYLYKYNKKMLESFILVLMKIAEKTLVTSGKNKFDLVVDIIMYVLEHIKLIIPINISRPTIENIAQQVFNENQETINNCKDVVAMYNLNKIKDVIKNIKEEICQKK